MGKETIELAKNYDPKKSVFPAIAQRKWDGVPVRFMCAAPGVVVAVTRQGEHVKSIPHLIEIVKAVLTTAGGCIIGELIIPGRDFKSVSGIARRITPDAETATLICKVFDGDMHNLPKTCYQNRLLSIAKALAEKAFDRRIVVTPGKYVDSVEGVERYHDDLKVKYGEDIEGVMFHDPVKPFQPGKRCWGMGRWKPQPVDTFQVVGFEQAIAETGEPLGRVGRIQVAIRRRGGAKGWAGPVEGSKIDWTYCIKEQVWTGIVGIGPGKLKHDEAADIWKDPCSYIGFYADVKHMPDPSYEALRQPTFQCWRPDKKEGDILEY